MTSYRDSVLNAAMDCSCEFSSAGSSILMALSVR